MALFLRRDDNRSQLQAKVAAELSERLKNKQQIEQEKPDQAILDNQHQMQVNPVKIVIWVLIIAFVALLLWLLRP